MASAETISPAHDLADRGRSPSPQPRSSPSRDVTRSASPRPRSPPPRQSPRSPSPPGRRSSPPPRDVTRSPSPRPRRSPSLRPHRSPSPRAAPRSPLPPRSRSPRRDDDDSRRRPDAPRRGGEGGRRGGGGGGDSYRPARDNRHPPPARRDGRLAPLPPPRTAASRPEPPPPPPPARTEEEKQAAAKAEYERLLNMRSGGTYIPPARLRALQAQITDKSSREYQRMAWEALKKSINGLINKVNVANIKAIVPELFAENLVRGRGLFCQSLTKAQAASLPFTPVYAATAAVVNTKLPQVGELLVKRLVLRFRKAFRRNDKAVCLATTTFVAHLVNQQVVHEALAAQMLVLLLQRPTDDSVEIAVGLTREVGQHLEDMNPEMARLVFDQFRTILHEADIDRRVQYMIEVLFQVRRDRFKDNPAVREELDLVEEEDQITHQISLDADIDGQETLNVFRYDERWEENEEAYRKLKNAILGEGSDDGSGSAASSDAEDDDDEDDDEDEDEEEKALEIKDQTNADLVNLRRTIYLTLQSSADPEEATHKLLKLRLPPGQEPELVSMVVESCAETKTYVKFYGLIAERVCRINRLWADLFEQSFARYYDTIHRYETNKLRNIARLFAHLLASDAIGWHVLSVVHLNEDETTSASRIFLKILFQDVAENMGMAKLRARLADEYLQPSLAGIFPRENPRHVRFSINYFTSIGMGALTQEMRDYLQRMPKPTLPAAAAPAAHSDSESVSSYSSYTGSSYSSRSRSRSRSLSRSPTPRRRGRSYSRSPSRDSRSRSRSYDSSSRSPPRRGRGAVARRRRSSPSISRSRSRSVSSYSRSPSRSPPRRGRRATRSLSESRSPPPPRRRRRPSYSASPSPPPRPPPTAAQQQRRRHSRSRSSSIGRRRSLSAASRRSPGGPPPRKRYRTVSRSPEPPRRGPARRRSYSASRSRSRSVSPPPRRRGRRSESRSRSRTRSPTPRDGYASRRRDARASVSPVGGGGKRRRYSSSRSRSPPPTKRGRVSG